MDFFKQETATKATEVMALSSFVNDIAFFLKSNRDVSHFELQNLIHEAMNSDKSPHHKENKIRNNGQMSKDENKLQKIKEPRGYLLFVKTLITLFLAFSIIGVTVYHHEENLLVSVDEKLNDILPDWNYHLLLRPARMISVYFDLPRQEELPECLYENPFKSDGHQKILENSVCGYCEATKHIIQIKTNFKNIQEVLEQNHFQPVIARQLGFTPSIADLRNILLDNSKLISSLPSQVTSSDPKINSVDNLTQPETLDAVLKDETMHLKWELYHYIAASQLKQIFPELEEFKASFKFQSSRVLYIDGPDADHYKAIKSDPNKFGGDELFYYHQSSGSRKVFLEPLKSCMGRCGVKAGTLYPGDILIFTPGIYSLRSERIGNQPSIAYLLKMKVRRDVLNNMKS